MTGAPPAHAPAFPLRLPAPALVFERRARRLETLAARGEGDPFLAFLGRLAAAQGEALGAAAGGPVDPARLPEDPALPGVLAALLRALRRGTALPGPAEAAVRGLGDASPAAIARIGSSLLGAGPGPSEVAAAPFVGAALQVLATARAAALDPAAPPRDEHGCPACGAPPVAGVIRGDDRLRVLTCALCASEWHLPRIRCASCDATAGLAYHHLEHDRGARAETCAACESYLKLFDLQERPGAEPLADDAATLALDLLLGEAGYGRGGLNLLVAAA